MKKGILVVIATVLLFGSNQVNAMSKSDLEDKLTKAYTINGATFQVSDSDANRIKRYLKQNDISRQDADEIAEAVDDAIKVIEKSGVTSLDKLPKKYREELVEICNDVSEKTAIKVTAYKKTITVYNIDGTKFDEFDSDVIDEDENTSKIVKKTGTSNIVILTSVVSLLGATLILRKEF